MHARRGARGARGLSQGMAACPPRARPIAGLAYGELPALIVGSAALVVSVSAAAVTGAVAMVFTVSVLAKRRSLGACWEVPLAIAVSIVYFAGFYSLAGGKAASYGASPTRLLADFFSAAGLGLRARMAGKLVIQTIGVYAVPLALTACLLPSAWRKLKAQRWLFAVFLVSAMGGLGAFLLTFPLGFDGLQLYLIPTLRFLNVLLAVCLLASLREGGRWRIPHAGAAAFVVLSQAGRAPDVYDRPQDRRSGDYLAAVAADQPRSRIGGFVRDREDLFREVGFTTHPRFVEGSSLLFDPRRWGMVLVSDTGAVASTSPEWQHILETTVFRSTVAELRGPKPAVTIEEAQRSFVVRHGIDWLVIPPHSRVPSQLEPLVSRIIRDPLSGERYVRLKLD